MHNIGIEELTEGHVLSEDIILDDIQYKSGTLVTTDILDCLISNMSNNLHIKVYTFSELKPRIYRDNNFSNEYTSYLTESFKKRYNPSVRNIPSMINVFKEMTNSLLSSKNLLHDLVLIKYSHEYTYNHSVNVALLSLRLGIKMGLMEEELYSLVYGALLHDIGKVVIPKVILDKPLGLSDKEFELMKSHPTIGVKLISDYGDINSAVYRIILEHHEKLDGTGYPRGLSKDKISLLSQIVTVCDMFDGITSKRAYHKENTMLNCLNLLQSDATHGKLNSDVVSILRSLSVLYPVSTYVKLSNNKTGYVVDTDKSGVRPLVYDILEDKLYDLREDNTLDVISGV